MVASSDVAAHVGERVLVAGKVASIAVSVLTVTDGTASVPVRLTGAATRLLDSIAVGDLVNATGVVTRTPTGGVEVVVDDPTGLLRASTVASPVGSSIDAVALSTHASGTGSVAAGGLAGESRLPLVAAVILLLTGAVFAAGFVAAGPKRRARLVAALREWRLTAMARLAGAPARMRRS